MSHSLTGDPAAERVERFLDARSEDPAYDLLCQADGLEIRASDLRAVLEELYEHRQAVSAVWAIPQQFGAGDYNRALVDARKALAEHVTGLKA